MATMTMAYPPGGFIKNAPGRSFPDGGFLPRNLTGDYSLLTKQEKRQTAVLAEVMHYAKEGQEEQSAQLTNIVDMYKLAKAQQAARARLIAKVERWTELNKEGNRAHRKVLDGTASGIANIEDLTELVTDIAAMQASIEQCELAVAEHANEYIDIQEILIQKYDAAVENGQKLAQTRAKMTEAVTKEYRGRNAAVPRAKKQTAAPSPNSVPSGTRAKSGAKPALAAQPVSHVDQRPKSPSAAWGSLGKKQGEAASLTPKKSEQKLRRAGSRASITRSDLTSTSTVSVNVGGPGSESDSDKDSVVLDLDSGNDSDTTQGTDPGLMEFTKIEDEDRRKLKEFKSLPVVGSPAFDSDVPEEQREQRHTVVFSHNSPTQHIKRDQPSAGRQVEPPRNPYRDLPMVEEDDDSDED